MTVKHLVQLCKLEFPQVFETEVINDINIVFSDFISATELYRKIATINVAESTRYKLSDYIPDIDGIDKNLIKSVTFYDINNDIIQDEVYIEFKNDIIIFYDDCGVESLPTGTHTIQIEYIAKAPTLTINDDLDIIPIRFHTYIQYGVLAKLYMRYPNIEKIYPDGGKAMVRDTQMITYYLQLYEKGKIEARRYGRTNPLLPTRQLRTDEA